MRRMVREVSNVEYIKEIGRGVVMPRQDEDLLRTRKIRIMRKGGASLREIGCAFDISGERVRQIWWRNTKRTNIDTQIKLGVLTREAAREKYGEGLSKGGVVKW